MHPDGVTVRAQGVTVAFGGVDVVKNVDLELQPGEIHAIIGENGAGKSSLAKVIAGVYRPRSGTVEVGEWKGVFRNPREALKHGVALIHQEPLTFPDLDVTENIFVGHHPGWAGAVDWPEARRRAKQILSTLGVTLSPAAKVAGLSVAQQQMVELAAAMSHEAKVWIFDETTAPLTPKEVEELFVVMRSLCKQGCAVAMVTHHLDEVFAIADRITVLRDGIKVAEKLPSETTVGELISLMVGRPILQNGSSLREGVGGWETTQGTEPVLQISNLSGPGFSNATLEVRAGEVVGVAGLVGAGRTELARAIFGITQPTEGSIRLNGNAVKIRSPREAEALGITLVPEDRQHDGLLMPQDVAFNATLAEISNLSKSGWLKRRRITEATNQYAERLRLSFRKLDQPVRELSGGNQQKVVLSKWFMSGPKLLILDEPTRGVDVGAKDEVHKLIREQANNGLAVLMISSDLAEILAMSDRIVVMRKGTTVATFNRAEATEQKIMAAAIGEEAAVGA